MRVRLAVWLCLIAVALLLTSCGCEEESDEQLCADRECGLATLIDGCGNERQVDCGECGAGQDCESFQCICEGESTEKLCDELGAECGEHRVTDQCGDTRTVECGSCSSGDCNAGVCECQAEPDDELCEAFDLQCGGASVQDRCGQTRELDCGGCSEDDEVCSDNVCECVGESDEELCDSIESACGTTEATDACGVERTIECQPCAEGESTFGAVRDADTGELLEGASIKVYAWPPPGGEHYSWYWEPGYRADDPDLATTTSAPSGDINYEFASEEPMCADDQVASLEAHQMYRYVVERDGYVPSVFYRVHPGYSAGDCDAACAAADDARCHRQDFELWPEGATYPQTPNLVVDSRDMEDRVWECALLPDDAPADELIGLRVRLGAINAGHGPYHLEAVEGDDGEGEILQHIEWSDGSVESRVVPSGTFEYDDSHQHIHFLRWFAMRLVTPSDDCRDVETRSDSCVLHDGVKISYCLHDLDEVDGDVLNWHGGDSSKFPDPPTCDTSEQGITEGWRDTYAKEIPGQVIIVGTPDDVAAMGQPWLEAEVDPDRVLEETERHGNVVRQVVAPPEDLCGDPDRVLDCSMPRDEYDREQRRHCPGYLEFFD